VTTTGGTGAWRSRSGIILGLFGGPVAHIAYDSAIAPFG
jgi:hypothetical protein